MPSKTATPTRAAYPTDVPADAQANTPAGAVAFANYFFGRMNTAYTTGQAGLLSPLTTTRCARCVTFEADLAALAAQGRRTVSGPVQLRGSNPSKEPHRADQTVVDVLFKMLPVKIVDAGGAAVGTVPNTRGIYVVALVRDGSVWRVDGIELLQ